MSLFNPLIGAPHVPSQTAAPKWGDFLEEGRYTIDPQPPSERQHQPVAWYQVKAAQQSQYGAHQGLQQALDIDPTRVQATSHSHVNASSRWQQQLDGGAQPRQHQPPWVNESTAFEHTAEQSSSSWVHQKTAKQRAVEQVRKDAQGNLPHVELRQSMASPQQEQRQMQRQLACQDVNLPEVHVHQAGHQHHLHCHKSAESPPWFDDQDDVQLPNDGGLLMLSTGQTAAVEQHQQQFGQGLQQQKPTRQHVCLQTANQKVHFQICHLQQQQQELQHPAAHCSQSHHHPGSQSAAQQMHSQTTQPQQCYNCRPAGAQVSMQHAGGVIGGRHGASILAAPSVAPQQHQQQAPSQEDCLHKQQDSWERPKVQQQRTPALGPAVTSRWAAAQPLPCHKIARTSAAAPNPAAVQGHTAEVNSSLEVTRLSSSGRQGNGRGSSASGADRGNPGRRVGRSTGDKAVANISTQCIPGSTGNDNCAQAEKRGKMHQETIFETFGRAKKRRQVEQLPAGQHQQNQDGKHHPDGTRNSIEEDTETSAAGHKRTSSAAAAARPRHPEHATDAGDSIAGSGRGRGSKKATKRARLSGQAATAATGVQDGREKLDLDSISSNSHAAAEDLTNTAGTSVTGAVGFIVGLSSQEAWQQLRQELAAAAGVALGLLLYQTAGPALQYYSSLQQLSKEQQQLLKKHAKVTAKTAAAGYSSCIDSVGPCQVAGIAIMPVAAVPAGRACSSSSSNGYKMHLLHLPVDPRSEGAVLGTQPMQLSAEAVQLLSSVLSNTSGCPCVCSNAKGVLCSLAGLGLPIPAAGSLSLVDPELMGWLLDPQLVQDSKHTSCYTLQAQLERLDVQQATAAVMSDQQPPGPLQRLHQQMQQSVQLADLLLMRLKNTVGGEALKLEMQVTAVLARMELSGVGIAPQYLLDQKATLLQRIAALNSQAAACAGRPFNLSSASQLATVLYEDLKLPPPAMGGGRGSAKTHLPTDEQSLKQLANLHPLPGIIVEYRCLQNVITKWMDPEWVQAASQAAGGGGVAGAGGVAGVHCSWNQAATATGRLSSSTPNLQAVTKYTITAHRQQQQQHQLFSSSGPNIPGVLSINIRDAFVSRPGTLLLSADYSQVELRLLAHFSGDPLLRHILQQTGSSGDVFKLIAATWMMQPGTSGKIDANNRERAKRVVYGIIYGLSAFGLSQQLAEQGLTVEAADTLINSFLNRFQGVKQFMSSCLQGAQSTGSVKTLLQRMRPIAGLTAGSHRDRSAAERRVVNSIIQGSAADLIKLAMRAWDDWVAAATSNHNAPAKQGKEAVPLVNTPSGPTDTLNPGGARLIAQIHDELLFEVDASDAVVAPDGSILAPGASLEHVAHVVQDIMAMGRLQLSVPLKVNLSWGQRWGSMQGLEYKQAKPSTVL